LHQALYVSQMGSEIPQAVGTSGADLAGARAGAKTMRSIFRGVRKFRAPSGLH